MHSLNKYAFPPRLQLATAYKLFRGIKQLLFNFYYCYVPLSVDPSGKHSLGLLAVNLLLSDASQLNYAI